MTKRQHPCTKRKSHKTYSVTKTKIESTLIITFFCGVKTKFCLAKQQKSKSCHLCHGCGATIYNLIFRIQSPISKVIFLSRRPNTKSICPKFFFCRHFLGLDVLVKFLSTVVIGKVGQDHKTWTWLEKLYDLNISAQYQGNNQAKPSAFCWKSYRNSWKR